MCENNKNVQENRIAKFIMDGIRNPCNRSTPPDDYVTKDEEEKVLHFVDPRGLSA